MDDKEAFREFRNGASFVIVVMCAIFLVIAIFGELRYEPEPKFKVVDKYKDCNVVRYTDSTNRWNYFLDCSGNRP